MENFGKTFDELINFAVKEIDNFSQSDLLSKFLPAFNRYSEDEKNFVGYVFDLRKREDVIDIIKGEKETNIRTLLKYMGDALSNGQPYIIFDEQKIMSYNTENMLKEILSAKKEVVYCMLSFPHVAEYNDLYNAIFFERILACRENYI